MLVVSSRAAALVLPQYPPHRRCKSAHCVLAFCFPRACSLIRGRFSRGGTVLGARAAWLFPWFLTLQRACSLVLNAREQPTGEAFAEFDSLDTMKVCCKSSCGRIHRAHERVMLLLARLLYNQRTGRGQPIFSFT